MPPNTCTGTCQITYPTPFPFWRWWHWVVGSGRLGSDVLAAVVVGTGAPNCLP